MPEDRREAALAGHALSHRMLRIFEAARAEVGRGCRRRAAHRVGPAILRPGRDPRRRAARGVPRRVRPRRPAARRRRRREVGRADRRGDGDRLRFGGHKTQTPTIVVRADPPHGFKGPVMAPAPTGERARSAVGRDPGAVAGARLLRDHPAARRTSRTRRRSTDRSLSSSSGSMPIMARNSSVVFTCGNGSARHRQAELLADRLPTVAGVVVDEAVGRHRRRARRRCAARTRASPRSRPASSGVNRFANMSSAMSICAGTPSSPGGTRGRTIWKIVLFALFHQPSVSRDDNNTTASGLRRPRSRARTRTPASRPRRGSRRGTRSSRACRRSPRACHTGMSSGRPNTSIMW